jgi:hypothetical protein
MLFRCAGPARRRIEDLFPEIGNEYGSEYLIDGPTFTLMLPAGRRAWLNEEHLPHPSRKFHVLSWESWSVLR